MRLINTTSLKLESFFSKKPPRYAILSHTWLPDDEEVTCQEYIRASPTIRCKAGLKKIEESCRIARDDGHKYIWIDTCCIDKRSSSELSEAINSMYRWYKDSDICYAYLADVHDLDVDWIETEFRRSKWFTRGWTLQELIAPLRLTLYNSRWEELGTRAELVHNIHQITKIHHHVLRHRTLQDCSVAQKMSWAARRKTARDEDRAYSLMGLFGVHMPLLYGEGDFAFIRLQEEIIRRSTDHSIFAWTSKLERNLLEEAGLLAPSPSNFEHSGDIVQVPNEEAQPFSLTNRGISIDLPTLSSGPLERIILDCRREELPERTRLTISLVESTRNRKNPGRSRYVGQELESYYPGTYDPAAPTTLPELKYHRMLLRAYSTTVPEVNGFYRALYVQMGNNLKAMGSQVIDNSPWKLQADKLSPVSFDNFGKWDEGVQIEYRDGIYKCRFDLAIRVHYANMEIELRETDKAGPFQSYYERDSLTKTIAGTHINLKHGELDHLGFRIGIIHRLCWSIPELMIEAAAEHRLIEGQKCLWVIVDRVRDDLRWGQHVTNWTRVLIRLLNKLLGENDVQYALKFLKSFIVHISCVLVVSATLPYILPRFQPLRPQVENQPDRRIT